MVLPVPYGGTVNAALGSVSLASETYAKLKVESSDITEAEFQFIFSCLVVALALIIHWLILGETSPYHEYFLWHVGVPNLWALTIFIPILVSAMISGNPHAPSTAIFMIGLAVQWFIVGLILSMLISKLVEH